jgi:serine/threonine protein kinase
MILPLADENLRQYWAHARSSSLEHHQFLKQMADLATALSYLHNDLVTQDSKPLAGYHMDLKPENILVEFDSSSCLYRLRISDFGSSKIRPKESSQELPPHPGLGTYEPPECQMELPISQAYDIWSLGCIYLECTAWLIKGSGAIDAFAEDRLNDVEIAGNVFKDDYFFTLEFDEFSNPIQAITRPAVIKWVRDLQGDPKCSDGIAQLLLVISNGLLQVERSKRIKAEWLHQRLELLHTSKMPMEFYSK